MSRSVIKTRFMCLSLVGIAACAAFIRTAEAQSQYTLTEIGNPGASYTALDGIDNRDEIAGDSDWRAFLWRNGKLIDLSGILGDDSDPAAINDRGQITGSYDRDSFGFLYTDGVVTDLGRVKNGLFSAPDDINDLGEVVFQALVVPPDDLDIFLSAYIYRNGTYELIPSLGGTESRGYAINNSGVVVGSATTKGEQFLHAFLYQNGKLTDLGTLGGLNSRANDINDIGTIAGFAEIAGTRNYHAFVSYTTSVGSRAKIDLGVLPGGAQSSARAVNNLNQIVGDSEVDARTHRQVGFIYTAGLMWNLNDLIDRRDPLYGRVRLFSAYGINDNGWIIAGGEDTRNPEAIKAYLLRPLLGP